MKKAQLGTVFIYILAIFIAAMVILLGYRFINNFQEKQDQIMISEFISDVTSQVRTTDFGSVVISKHRVPSQYSMVCFVDYRTTTAEASSLNLPQLAQQELSIRSGEIFERNPETATNLFIIDEQNNIMESKSVGKVVEGNKFFCTRIEGGRFELKYTGVQGGVQITT